MNTLNYLLNTFPLPFYVTDGKEFYKISYKSSNCCIALKQKVLFNGKFKTVPGGWVLDNSECSQRKWGFIVPDGRLSESQKFKLAAETDIMSSGCLNDKESYRQLEMIFLD